MEHDDGVGHELVLRALDGIGLLLMSLDATVREIRDLLTDGADEAEADA